MTDSHVIGLWHEIARAHSSPYNVGLVKTLKAPHDYLSLHVQTESWKRTAQTLDTASDEKMAAIAYCADLNLRMAKTELQYRVAFGAFLAALSGIALLTLFIIGALVTSAILSVPTFVGYYRAMHMKLNVEYYINVRASVTPARP